MHFASFSEFLAMGGYAPYVWSAFAITFFSMGCLIGSSLLTHRKLLKEIDYKIAREKRLQQAKNRENTL